MLQRAITKLLVFPQCLRINIGIVPHIWPRSPPSSFPIPYALIITLFAGASDSLFSTSSRLTLGHSQPPHRIGPGGSSAEVRWSRREADHSPEFSVKVKNDGTTTPLPPFVLSQRSLKQRYQFPLLPGHSALRSGLRFKSARTFN
jgi:hypothetical protein